MNDLDRVLRSIQKALDGLESRVRQQIAQGSDPVISFSQRADRQAQANEVLVGFGRLSDPISEGTGIVLNNKSLPKISDFSDKIDCITDLVLTVRLMRFLQIRASINRQLKARLRSRKKHYPLSRARIKLISSLGYKLESAVLMRIASSLTH